MELLTADWLGTPVWFWSLSSPVRSWLEANPLRGKRFAFFCTMGGSGARRSGFRSGSARPVRGLAISNGRPSRRAKAPALVL